MSTQDDTSSKTGTSESILSENHSSSFTRNWQTIVKDASESFYDVAHSEKSKPKLSAFSLPTRQEVVHDDAVICDKKIKILDVDERRCQDEEASGNFYTESPDDLHRVAVKNVFTGEHDDHTSRKNFQSSSSCSRGVKGGESNIMDWEQQINSLFLDTIGFVFPFLTVREVRGVEMTNKVVKKHLREDNLCKLTRDWWFCNDVSDNLFAIGDKDAAASWQWVFEKNLSCENLRSFSVGPPSHKKRAVHQNMMAKAIVAFVTSNYYRCHDRSSDEEDAVEKQDEDEKNKNRDSRSCDVDMELQQRTLSQKNQLCSMPKLKSIFIDTVSYPADLSHKTPHVTKMNLLDMGTFLDLLELVVAAHNYNLESFFIHVHMDLMVCQSFFNDETIIDFPWLREYCILHNSLRGPSATWSISSTTNVYPSIIKKVATLETVQEIADALIDALMTQETVARRCGYF